jgi:hypothetical protein
MMTLKKRLLLWLLLPVLLAGCQKEKRSDFRLYRFIDELRLENILESPFLERGEPGEVVPLAPPKSSPLLDLGSGENSFSLKKKIKLEGAEINILFAPPPSVYRYEPTVAAGGTIEFGIGIIQDKNSERLPVQNSPAERGVCFKVSLERKGRREVVFQEFMALPPPNEYQLSFHSIEASAFRRRGALCLLV